MSVADFNDLPPAAARDALALCCVSERWIDRMLARRPFSSREAMLDCANSVWETLGEDDYLEAFEGHPRIGDVASLKARYAHSEELARGEQSGVSGADDATIARLAGGNRRYEERFGFMFIVCATGKSAAQMCELLEARLNNSREQELKIAAEEQRRILQLRLEKLV